MEQASEPVKKEVKKEEPREFVLTLYTESGTTKIAIAAEWKGAWDRYLETLHDPEKPTLTAYWKWKNSFKTPHYVYK